MTACSGQEKLVPEWLKLPHAERGNRIGIFGGSFNPAHSGHLLVAETALKRLDLDQVWWLVTPGNPLKDHAELAPLEMRVHMTSALANHPKMRVCAHEVILGSPYTAKTIQLLKRKRPALNFVWIMGADNLAGFHHWQDWRSIVQTVPIAIIDRPGSSLATLGAPLAKAYERQRVAEEDASLLADLKPPAWTFLHSALDNTSSTGLRQKKIP
ncbi:nicotinate-nucleotide adenylyltransferase [Roseibium polysiphoniae]|uniref:Probable nicotinate-nucleotide adenylyltransferase n=1 Tax=Roseibium polysiphoniae TaxID=2571221 RepID=A0ABR9CFP1_9HYPH|nr:nicotinate-nucleotide adenylyltransferase [Roseibium polysiphoniae]MBD8878458.1 nicotinate-nucleotide adenylyltransferase [Roseibium polysiphoniae]